MAGDSLTGRISPDSVSYWSRCLYGDFFDSDQTYDALGASREELQAYASKTHQAVSPYGDVYYAELDSILRDGLTVLELGCGPGVNAYYMQKHGAKVTACDIVPSNVELCQRILEPEGRAILLQSYDDLDNLGTFDLVYSHGCLHHIPPDSIGYVLEKLRNRMHPGSKALVMVYTDWFYPYPNRHPEGPWSRGYTSGELAVLFGPTVPCLSVRVFMLGCFMWGLFEKQ